MLPSPLAAMTMRMRVRVHMHACAFALCVHAHLCTLSASLSLHNISLTCSPAPRHLPAWPTWDSDFQEGLDSALLPAVREPLADFLQVTWPPGHPPLSQYPPPGLNSYT